MNRRTIIIVVVTAIVGLIIGAAISGGASNTTAAAPEVKTETQTIPSTVTQTTTHTPESCRTALQQENDALGSLLSATKIYTAQIIPAYKAGMLGSSVDQIGANMKVGNAKVASATKLVTAARVSATDCLSHG